jgi:hypothetical protein
MSVKQTTFLATVLSLTALAGAQVPQEKRGDKPPKEKVTPVGTVVGKISKLARDKASFTLKVSADVPYQKSSNSSKSGSVGLKKVRESLEIQVAGDAKIKLMENGKPTDSSPGDLRKGQTVEVTLVKNRLGELFAKSVVIFP